MKKVILILFALLALQAPAIGHAAPKQYTVLLAGGVEESMIYIWLSADGRDYVIDSVAQLEVGGGICAHPLGNPNELVCSAPMIAGFEVNAGDGADRVAVARNVSVPVTMRGGAGDDFLLGGAGPDKLIGGAGSDRLVGWRGADVLYGGPGRDVLIAGPGSDVLRGDESRDTLKDGPGVDDTRQFRRSQ